MAASRLDPTRPRRDARPDMVAFIHALRRTGITVPTGQVLAFIDAAAAVAPVDTSDLYWVGRITLISYPHDLDRYDAVFRQLFLDCAGVSVEAPTPPPFTDVTVTGGQPDEGGEGEADEDSEPVGGTASNVTLLRHRRFDEATDVELVAIAQLMQQLRVTTPRRVSRRTEPVRRGRHPDLRASVRQALRTDGELVHRRWRHRRRVPRPLVLLLDVSGSMHGYSRALLQFAYSTRRHTSRLEVFCFSTRLTRITDELDERDVDVALAAAADRVVDWDGGTRIGGSLATLTRQAGRRGRLRGAVVVICSDGLERGDPQVLAEEMARVRRFAHTVVWVNPLKGDPRFTPLQRGMAAALPHVDRLMASHDLASLETLASVLSRVR